MTDKKVLVSTITGEPQQPVRIYYQVFNQKTVLGVFKKLRCVYFEKLAARWRWMYEHEAKKLRFETSYQKIPKENRPVVIGDFFFRGSKEMLLEVRSFVRATKAIEFFDRRINRHAAKVTKIRVVNKLFDANEPSVKELLEPPYDRFFDRDDVAIPNPDEVEKKMKKMAEEHEEPERRMAAFMAYMEETAKETLPEVSEIPVRFYEEGITSLELALTLRNIETIQHWQGNENFSQLDAIQTIAQGMVDV